MTALVRYQAALLIRSQRWLPPVLLYGVIMAIGISSGQPLLDSLAFAAAGMLPVAAWLVRVCVTNEPPAARACAAAAAGPGRVHLSSVLTALLAAGALGAAGVAVVAVISDAHTADRRHVVPLGPAVTAGLLAVLVSALLGLAVGALTNPPVLRRAGWAIPVSGLSALLVLVIGGSPANAAVSGLVSGSQTGTVGLPLLPLCLAAVAAAAATAVACALGSRR
ncbi:ABC transporter [Streptomyces sp. SID13588]|uniref:ABC transporter n=1 Tax=Streptomyces sp. SID13588 TaxID=2706051 RepID=UPI0013C7440B|nr:ABC transporter [Streptomyces sp. SID13588]NEA73424.1 ABC transporter [Streptomyces sp. SID13588]